VLLIDERFKRKEIILKLPGWMQRSVTVAGDDFKMEVEQFFRDR